MKKILIALVLFVSFALLSAAPVFAAMTWAELADETENTDKRVDMHKGHSALMYIKQKAPQGTELDLWNKLWVGEPFERAAAGVALMDRVFPGGDPGRWEEAAGNAHMDKGGDPGRWEETEGFLSKNSYKSRQLAGMDAFFVTLAALDKIPGGESAAAVLMESFSKSTKGMVYFIEHMPQGLQASIDSIIAKTGLRGDWTAKTTERQLPLLPVFRGSMARDTVESQRLIYLDGAGRIASNGYYAWNRDRGSLYRVTDYDD